MYAPYPENMMESIKKVEATRAQRMATEPRRLTAEEKDALLEKFHPDYNPDAFCRNQSRTEQRTESSSGTGRDAPFNKPSDQRKN